MKLGEQNAVLLSQHNSFVMIINAALGEAPKGPTRPGANGVKDLTAGHADIHSAIAAINAAL